MATQLITLDEAKSHLRLEAGYTLEDNLITDKISSATSFVEFVIQRYILPVTFTKYFRTNSPAITLQHIDVAITSVSYYKKYQDYFREENKVVLKSNQYKLIDGNTLNAVTSQVLLDNEALQSIEELYNWEIIYTSEIATADIKPRWKEAALHVLTYLYENRTISPYTNAYVERSVKIMLAQDINYNQEAI